MKTYKKNYLLELSEKQQRFLMSKDFYLKKKLEVFEYSEAYVLPTIRAKIRRPTFVGGVVDTNHKFVKESGIYAYGTNDKVIDSYDFLDEETVFIDEEVIYMNTFFNQWGHFLLDSIPRLWYALENKNLKIAYSCVTSINSNITKNNNFGRVIELLGIPLDRLICVDKKVTRFKKVIVPESSIYEGKYYTEEYAKLINTIINNSLAIKTTIMLYDKIYLSRKNFALAETKEINEKEVENIFITNGYKEIFMEEYSVEEQIHILNNAKHIVSLSGTLAHNCMFITNENCIFTIINKTYRTNIIQYQVNELSKAKIDFVDCYISPMPISNGRGPFWYAVGRCMKEFCEDYNLCFTHYTKITIKGLLKYYYKWLRTYRNRLLEYKTIGDSDIEECQIYYNDIRCFYKKNIKQYF